MPAFAAEPVNLGQLWSLAAPLWLTFWGLVVLLLDVALMRGASSPSRRKRLGLLSLLGPIGVLVLLLTPLLVPSEVVSDPDPTLFYGTIAGDLLTQSFHALIALLLAMVLGLSLTWDFTEHWGPYYALMLWAGVGMMILVSAEELLILLISLEMMTICLYLASAFEKSRLRSSEAGMKYFVYGSVCSALFLFGLSLIYGLTGTTHLDGIRKVLLDRVGGEVSLGLAGDVLGGTAVLLVLVGFGFKIAAVPFHQWAPDTYEGAPAPVSAWIASGSKVAGFVALMKVFLHALGPWAGTAGTEGAGGWVLILALIAAITMTFGNLAALGQRNLKRLLAYSSIAHAGYILVGVVAAAVTIRVGSTRGETAGSVLFYLVIYSLTTVGAFAVAAWLASDKGRDDIDDLNGLGFSSPGLAACIVVLMLSLIGMPPTAGFFAKLYLFLEVLNADPTARPLLLTLVALALVNSVISAFYYARVLRAMFLRQGDRAPKPATRGVAWPIGLATLVALGFGLAPTPLLDAMRTAGSSMLAITLPATDLDRDRERSAPAAIPSAATANPESAPTFAPAPRIATAHRRP
ncbi:NADH-quinone oxidoreductase subunit N [Tautonia marina]|uniref:NADH-quinone oxidoreductase subunit N n=1 Tax=Tautonia marina TaxID=2653855 RepID=UPI0012605387|nr:NADH-quinone oxidoreductase subunit N [Tautonia marina]